MDTQLSLSVVVPKTTDDELADITREITTWIRDSVESCEVRPKTVVGGPGAKGFLEVLGRLGVNLLAPGALKALIDCLAVYIKERRRDVVLTLETASGAKVSLTAGGLGRSELQALLHQLSSVMNNTTVSHP